MVDYVVVDEKLFAGRHLLRIPNLHFFSQNQDQDGYYKKKYIRKKNKKDEDWKRSIW